MVFNIRFIRQFLIFAFNGLYCFGLIEFLFAFRSFRFTSRIIIFVDYFLANRFDEVAILIVVILNDF